jgi:hypothetical protein
MTWTVQRSAKKDVVLHLRTSTSLEPKLPV